MWQQERGVYRSGVDQPEQHEGGCHAEEGEDVGDAAGISQGVTLANEVVVEQEVGGYEGVEDPDQGDGQRGDDVAVLDHLVQPKACSRVRLQALSRSESARFASARICLPPLQHC